MKSPRDAGINTKDRCRIKQDRKMNKKKNKHGRKNRDKNNRMNKNGCSDEPE
jgi:hypothetical protein